jgi:hypothetical protein
MYVAGAQRLIESCNRLGVQCDMRSLDFVVPSDRQGAILFKAWLGMIQQVYDSLLSSNGEPVMLIGSDDELARVPLLPVSGPDVGFWRNPELDTENTPLIFAAQWIVWPTPCGIAFVETVLDIMCRYNMNDHRAFNAAWFLGANLRFLPIDLTHEMRGVVSRTPSPEKPEWNIEFQEAINNRKEARNGQQEKDSEESPNQEDNQGENID